MPATDRRTDWKGWIREAAARLGFDLCGISSAATPARDREQYLWWLEEGFHGEMKYMERPQRQDIRRLLPRVRSVICAAMVYNTPYPKSTESPDATRGWISRYAWGEDYHGVLQDRLEKLLQELRAVVGDPFDAKIYVDTGPLLERALARAAGLGWIAKNTCLIHQKLGSWFVVGEILTSLELEPDQPVPDRCGACTRCIDACPTAAIVKPHVLDATRCISYFTIELQGTIPEEHRAGMGRHVFGCDICQDVCPWNRKAPFTPLPKFQPRTDSFDPRGGESAREPEKHFPAPNIFNPPLDWLASLTEEEFRKLFRRSPLRRARYQGLLRNVAVAMGNSREPKFLPILQKLAEYPDPIVQEHARWALRKLDSREN
ncbi:MAG: tRNA epoxyqueuosine(34) reductase QueG [Acidobacteria bacterium RIFCSPLOWO2_12_FULL_59_11]|nr:MAG: tRNA epoxyqueuosine(34) reductase QueG [Acidobacteria bacterium RIFCSPLOWO2_12_FULL_59_11]